MCPVLEEYRKQHVAMSKLPKYMILCGSWNNDEDEDEDNNENENTYILPL